MPEVLHPNQAHWTRRLLAAMCPALNILSQANVSISPVQARGHTREHGPGRAPPISSTSIWFPCASCRLQTFTLYAGSCNSNGLTLEEVDATRAAGGSGFTTMFTLRETLSDALHGAYTAAKAGGYFSSPWFAQCNCSVAAHDVPAPGNGSSSSSSAGGKATTRRLMQQRQGTPHALLPSGAGLRGPPHNHDTQQWAGVEPESAETAVAAVADAHAAGAGSMDAVHSQRHVMGASVGTSTSTAEDVADEADDPPEPPSMEPYVHTWALPLFVVGAVFLCGGWLGAIFVVVGASRCVFALRTCLLIRYPKQLTWANRKQAGHAVVPALVYLVVWCLKVWL